MYCNHCGKENPDGSKMCSSCGLEIGKTEKINNTQSKTDKKKLITFGGIGFGVLAVIILVIVIASSATSKVSLKKYVAEELEYSGLNGYGFVENADSLINWAALQSDISDGKDDRYVDGHYAPIAGYITYEITSENNGTLSNGDKVVFTVRIAQDKLEENPAYKKEISGGEEQKFEFTVSGLEEGVTIDVFDAVEGVVIDSTLNNNVTIKVKDNYVRDYGKDGINVKTENGKIRVYGDNFQSFEISVHSRSDNYDKTKGTHKLVTSVEADGYKNYGILLAKTEADVNITYISYVADNTINSADLAKITQKAKDDIKNRFPDQNCTLEKTILYVYDGTRYYNSVVYFFRGTDSYYAVWCDNVKQYSNNSIVDIDKLKIDSNAWYMAYSSLAEAERDMLKPVKQFTLSAS